MRHPGSSKTKRNRAIRWGLKWELSAYVSVPATARLGLVDGKRARSTSAAFCMSALLNNTFGNSQVES